MDAAPSPVQLLVAATCTLRLTCRFDVVETGWRAELGARTTEILGRFGVAGRVEVEGQLVWLIGHGPTVKVTLPELATTSAAQTPAELQRLAERLARDLATARRHAAGKSDSGSNWIGWLKLTPPIVIAVGCIWAASSYLLPKPNRPHSPTKIALSTVSRPTDPLGDLLTEKRGLDYRACLQTVTRIQRGGSVTPLDADGWVVELSLLSDKNDLEPMSPLLRDFFATRPGDIERTQHWTGAPILRQVDPTRAGVLVSKEPLVEAAPGASSGIKVTWTGQYVALYFKEIERSEFTRLADTLYRTTGSRYGALYARCAQGQTRYLGSWFRGPDIGGAVWSLMAEMGLFSEVPQIPDVKPGDGPQQWVIPLNRLAISSRSMIRKQAAFILASTSGSVSERPGQYATLEFPFAEGSRANTASIRFIRALTIRSGGTLRTVDPGP